MRISKTVVLAALLAACSTRVKEPLPDAGASIPATGTSAVQPSRALTSAAPSAAPAAPRASALAPEPAASATEEAASPTGSAYFGCGAAIPVAHLWDETTESQVLEAISVAKQCAATHGRRLLLEFVAPWCADCREMAALDETAVVSETLRARFERVRVNVGKWDRHEALRENHRVKALATYIVIDPKTSRVIAQTTLEPITKKHGKKLTAEDWASWLKSK